MRDNPNLTPEQIDRVRSVAQLRSVQAGEVLYEPSQPDVPLFIVLEGNVSISRTGEDDKILAVREANQFTGEMSIISGKRSLLKARVTGEGSVLEISRDKVLSLMAKDTELGEIFMEAFVARRLWWEEATQPGSPRFFSPSRRRWCISSCVLRSFPILCLNI